MIDRHKVINIGVIIAIVFGIAIFACDSLERTYTCIMEVR